MKSIFKCIIAVAVSSLLLSSCATILTPGSPTIELYGLPEEQVVTIETNKKVYYDVNLPCMVKVSRRHIDGQPIAVRANGQKHVYYLRKKTNPVTFGNILIGGLIGLGIDCITNCVSVPEYKSIGNYIRVDQFLYKCLIL